MKNDSWFGLDKIWHWLEHFVLTLVLALVFGGLIAVISSEVVGFGTEFIQELRGHSVSKKDIFWNHCGCFAGMLVYGSLIYKFG